MENDESLIGPLPHGPQQLPDLPRLPPKQLCLRMIWVNPQHCRQTLTARLQVLPPVISAKPLRVTTVQNRTYSLLRSDLGEPDGVER